MSRVEILDQISKERDYQDNLWGGPDIDDKENGYMEWVGYIAKYATKWFPGGFPPYNEEVDAAFRTSMIKVAALAVAAVEQFDRKRDK